MSVRNSWAGAGAAEPSPMSRAKEIELKDFIFVSKLAFEFDY
jgi:hypothetical protein